MLILNSFTPCTGITLTDDERDVAYQQLLEAFRALELQGKNAKLPATYEEAAEYYDAFAMARLQTVAIDSGPRDAAVAAFREGVRLLTGEPVMRRFLQIDGEFTATTEMVAEARRRAHPPGGLAGSGQHGGTRCHRRRRGGRLRANLPRTAGALTSQGIERNRTAVSTGVARF